MSDLPTTRWSLIRACGSDDTQAVEAWESLVETYRPAVLAYFRRALSDVDAEDLCQSFITDSIEKGWWARADSEQGSFRCFLFMMLRRFQGKHLSRTRLAFEAGGTDEVEGLADPEGRTEDYFDLAFVLALTQRALETLRAQYAARGRKYLFDGVSPLLTDPPRHGELQTIAANLDIRPNTLTVELKRLRSRLKARMREEVTEMCNSDEQLEVELAVLRAIIG